VVRSGVRCSGPFAIGDFSRCVAGPV
jgi:hypothetical protein